jgi:hypothetical protein
VVDGRLRCTARWETPGDDEDRRGFGRVRETELDASGAFRRTAVFLLVITM